MGNLLEVNSNVTNYDFIQGCVTSTKYLHTNIINANYLKEIVDYILNYLYQISTYFNHHDKYALLPYTNKRLARYIYYNVYETLESDFSSNSIKYSSLDFPDAFFKSNYKFIAVLINYINFRFNKTLGYSESLNENKKLLDAVLSYCFSFVNAKEYYFPCFIDNENFKYNDEKIHEKNIFMENNLIIYLFLGICLILVLIFIFRYFYVKIKKTYLKHIELITNRYNKSNEVMEESLNLNTITDENNLQNEIQHLNKTEKINNIYVCHKCNKDSPNMSQNSSLNINYITESIPIINNISESSFELTNNDLINSESKKSTLYNGNNFKIRQNPNAKKSVPIYATINKSIKTNKNTNEV